MDLEVAGATSLNNLPKLVVCTERKEWNICFGKGLKNVDHKAMLSAIKDTEGVENPKTTKSGRLFLGAAIFISLLLGIKHYMLTVRG